MKLGKFLAADREEFKSNEETCSDDEIIGNWHRGRHEYEVEPGWREDIMHKTDSGFVDCEMPEMVIFLKKSNYSFVKDIGIDMEISCREKCSMESCELNHHFISSFLSFDEDTNGKSTQEAPSTLLSVLNPPKSSSEHDRNKEVAWHCGPTSFSMECKGDFDASTDIADDSSATNYNIGTVGRKLLNGNSAICNISTMSSSLVTTNTGRESNFTSVSPHSVPVACSGLASYSQRISVQSNGNDSARSFSFPVLPTEWNGSPVRMAEADRRRRLVKHTRWRKLFLCCKF